jgi:uncharacterized protein YodC (DUF2158 family)
VFEIGDVVQLRGGSADMTVTHAGNEWVSVAWTNDGDELEREDFHRDALRRSRQPAGDDSETEPAY